MKNLILKPRSTDWIKGISSPIVFKAVTDNWVTHLEFFETQKDSFETNGCVLFTTQESFDAQMDALWPTIPLAVQAQITSMGFMQTGTDGQLHFHSSPRFLQIQTGNGYNGNAVQDGWDAIRTYGCLPWADLPYDDTITSETYLTGVTPTLLAKAASFLALIGGKNAIQYHWLVNGTPKNIPQIAQSLPQAPLCLGVVVAGNWNQVSPSPDPVSGADPGHCIMNYAVVGETLSCLDHYVPFEKILDAGYPVNYVFQGIVSPIFAPPLPAPLPPSPTPVQESNWLTQVGLWIQNILSQLKAENLQSNKMNTVNYSLLKSKTFWSAVLLFVFNGFNAISGSVPSEYSVPINFILTAAVGYFHLSGVNAAAVSSASLGKAVSGQ
jgi:hypothetical protein